MARAIWLKLEALIEEYGDLKNDIRGVARVRQKAIGREIASLEITVNEADDYHTAQTADLIAYEAKFGGEYYPRWMMFEDSDRMLYETE